MDEARTSDARALSQATASRIPVRSVSIAIVMTVVLYVVMTTLTNWEAFGTAVIALPGLLWVQVVVLSLLSYLFRFARWHYFIVILGTKVPILRNLEIYLAAFALTLTPGKVGESIRSIYLHPYGVSYSHSISAFVSERLLDLVVVGALTSLVLSMFPGQRLWFFAAIACFAVALLLLRSCLLNLIVKRAASNSSFYQATNLLATLSFLLSGKRLAVAAPLSLMAWIAQGVSLYFIINALGYELKLSIVIGMYCLSILAGAVSFIPGGLGATEAAIVILLISADVTQSDAIAAALISRGITLWLAVGVGCIALTKVALAHKRETLYVAEK